MKKIAHLLLITALTMSAIMMTQGAAMAQTMEVNYSWSAPTTGSPVDHYIVQLSVDGGSWTQIGTAASNTYTLTATVGHSHRIRVSGVDAQDRQGTYSAASDPYTPDPGPPGQPGKPILF